MKAIKKILIYIFNPYKYWIVEGIEFRQDNYTKLVYYKKIESTIDGQQIIWIRIS
jgi:hypothetical protein